MYVDISAAGERYCSELINNLLTKEIGALGFIKFYLVSVSLQLTTEFHLKMDKMKALAVLFFCIQTIQAGPTPIVLWHGMGM